MTNFLLNAPLFMTALAIGTASLASESPSAHSAEIRPLEEHPELGDLPGKWEPLLQEFHAPGISLVVVEGDKVWGWLPGERDPIQHLPVNVDTMYYIASITKTYTAARVLQLAEADQLDLDAPVTCYLPRFEPGKSDGPSPITVRDLIDHRAALSIPGWGMLEAYTGEANDDRFYRLLKSVGISGPSPRYDNENLTTAGRVIEAVTGNSWKDELIERVFKPIGMNRTTTYASAAYADKNVALPASWNATSSSFAYALKKEDSQMHAAGGMFTTARDAATWLRAMLNGGEVNGARLMSSDHIQEAVSMQAKRARPEGDLWIVDGYGYPWEIGHFGAEPIVQHTGGYMGAGVSTMVLLPDRNVGIAAFSSSAGVGGLVMLVAQTDIAATLTGEEPAFDVAERFGAMLRERGAPPVPEMRALTAQADEIAGIPEALGTFSHPLWGTLEIEARGAGVGARLGVLDLAVASSDGALEVLGPIGSGDTFRYLDEEDSWVTDTFFPEPVTFGRVKSR